MRIARPMSHRIAPGIARQVRLFSNLAGKPVAASSFKASMISQSLAALDTRASRLLEQSCSHNPTLGLAKFVSQSLIAPEPVDAQRLIDMGCQSPSSPQFYNKKPGDMQPANALNLVNAFTPLNSLVDQYVADKLKDTEQTKLIPFTHSTGSDKPISLILAQGRLLDMAGSTGIASQAGICMSTDLLGSSVLRALCGDGAASMIFYSTAEPEKLRISKSMYAMSDRTTVVSNSEMLRIKPSAYYSQSKNRLEIIDTMQFVDGPLTSAVISYHLLEQQYFVNLAAFIDQFNIPFFTASGVKVSFETLMNKPIDEGYQILEETLMRFKESIGNKNFQARVYFEAIQSRLNLIRTGLGEALKRPEIQNALLTRPQLKELAEEIAHPEHAPKRTPTSKL